MATPLHQPPRANPLAAPDGAGPVIVLKTTVVTFPVVLLPVAGMRVVPGGVSVTVVVPSCTVVVAGAGDGVGVGVTDGFWGRGDGAVGLGVGVEEEEEGGGRLDDVGGAEEVEDVVTVKRGQRWARVDISGMAKGEIRSGFSSGGHVPAAHISSSTPLAELWSSKPQDMREH